MLTAFARAFQTPDLRKKLLFTLGIMVLFRLGQHVPVPGVSLRTSSTCMDEAKGQQGLFGLVNMFSGGALLQLTIFALGHHAVHHSEHHPSAAGRGHSAAGGPEEGGPGRPGARSRSTRVI